MKQRGFIFDTNLCTGCNACQLACTLENQLDFIRSWRKVVTFNPGHLPGHPVYHLSLACNHCAEPDCLKYCPALAYTKDLETGHVLLNPDHCIGCKYCAWVCSYDAPLYDKSAGSMTKCNLCEHRYQENLEPACVTVCPTGALKTGKLTIGENITAISGFPQTAMKPAIEIIPLHAGRKLPGSATLPFEEKVIERYRNSLVATEQKITPGSEWSLILFTYLAALLVGDTFAALFSSSLLNPIQFFLLLVCTFGISLAHLGRKSRAMRTVLNWRNSWLSREIILFGFFSVISLASRFFPAGIAVSRPVAAVAGIAALFAMDRVYSVLPQNAHSGIRNQALLLTGLMFAVIIVGFTVAVIPVLGLKAWLFLSNYRISIHYQKSNFVHFLAAGRILTGFVMLPATSFIQWFPSDMLIFLLISELLDRIIFYLSLTIVSPEIQITQDLRTHL